MPLLHITRKAENTRVKGADHPWNFAQLAVRGSGTLMGRTIDPSSEGNGKSLPVMVPGGPGNTCNDLEARGLCRADQRAMGCLS